jgi:hypothetical protein
MQTPCFLPGRKWIVIHHIELISCFEGFGDISIAYLQARAWQEHFSPIFLIWFKREVWEIHSTLRSINESYDWIFSSKCGRNNIELVYLRQCATSRKVSGSRPDEVIMLSVYPNFLAALYSGANSASNSDQYQRQKLKTKFLGSRARPVGDADITATWRLLSGKCGILNISQPYRPRWHRPRSTT